MTLEIQNQRPTGYHKEHTGLPITPITSSSRVVATPSSSTPTTQTLLLPPIQALLLHQQLQLHLSRTVRNILMPAAIDSLPTLSSSRGSRRRRPYTLREHAVVDPAAGSWGGQRPGGSGDGQRGQQQQQQQQPSPMSTSPLPPDEVHTFPGICDDHPPDDLSSIALAPFDDVGTLQAEEMQTADSFRSTPEVLAMAESRPGELPMLPVAGRGHATPSTIVAPQQRQFPPEASGPLQQSGLLVGGIQGMDLKQEIPSPTDLPLPGTSTYPGSSSQGASGSGWGTSSTPSPSSPVIPLTALELLNRDSSSSSSDGESSRTHAKAATGSSKSRRSSTSGSTLDRRKESDEDDYSDLEGRDEKDLTPDEKGRLDRRRLSNRVAAQKCRQRQRQHHRGLMKEIQDWECKNTGLSYEVRQLQKTLRQMLDEVKQHESQCTTGTAVLTPEEKQAYQKLLDDVTAAQSQTKDSSKSSK